MDRRTLLGAMATLPLADAYPATAAGDESYWRRIAAQYDVTREVIQLENGNWGMMARPVLDAYKANLERVNRGTSYYTRRRFGADAVAARDALAAEMGVPADEIAFTRNATEALKALILGYNRLKPGDAVLYADLDYDSMQDCMESLRVRRGVTVHRIALPEPATRASLIDAYRAAFDANPRVRMVLLTHLSHRTGLVLPVREIAVMARERGIDAIVDAAHSWGQIDMTVADLDCDFVGLNCHKWLGAPLGVGALHVRRGALDRIDRDPAEPSDARDTIQSRVHTGTSDFAAILTLPAALTFQRSIGRTRRAARLAGLRNRWVDGVRHHPRIEVLTPDDPSLHGGITSFRFRDMTDIASNAALARQLLERHGIFAVHRAGPAKGTCVRVTPALFNSVEQMDQLAQAIRQEAATFATGSRRR